MNINAKQLTIFDIHKMDITTALGFFGQMKTLAAEVAPAVVTTPAVVITAVAAPVAVTKCK